MSALKNFRVDSFVSGLAIKAPVHVATDIAITLSGEQDVNSVTVLVGDRVLVKDQADPIENGIYVVESSAWQRAGDMDGERDIVGGTVVPAYRDSDGLFVYWIITGTPDSLSPGVDALTFNVYYDPAIAGAALPVSSTQLSSLAADNAGGWIEVTGVRIQDATDSLYIDGNLIITDNGTANSMQIVASGGDHYTIVATNNYYIDINPPVRFDSPEFYMLQKAAAGADLAGYGQFWVRTSDDAPMFTTEAGVDFQLNTAPSFTPPLVLADDDEIQLGDSTDAFLKWTAAGLGGGAGLQLGFAVTNSVFGITSAPEIRLYNSFGSGYISIENQGILSANDLVWDSAGGTSNIDYRVGAWDHNDNRLLRPVLDDYAIQDQIIGSAAGTLNVSFEDGNSAYLALTEDITTVNFQNPPASGRLGQIEWEVLQDSTARTITWPAAVEWIGGTAPDLSTINSKHLIHFRTRDGGTTILGTHAGPFS